MLNRIGRTVTGVMLAVALGFAQTAPVAKDQIEADLFNNIAKETDPAKKIAMLGEWSQKYPDTQFKQQKNLFYIQAYDAQLKAANAAGASPDAMAAGDVAAHAFIDKQDEIFGEANRMANVPAPQWEAIKVAELALAKSTIPALLIAKKDYAGAEAEYKKMLAANPDDAATSYLLGSAIASQHNVARIPEALFSFARAALVTGPGALNPEGKTATEAYLQKQYKSYHGDMSGIDDLKAQAAKSPLPPEGFHIMSVTEIMKSQAGAEEKLLAAHPEVGTWRAIKASLQADAGEAYFTKDLKDTAVPLKGKVVGQPTPKELTVAIDTLTPEAANVAEATLVFDSPLKEVPVGTDVSFTGVPESFTKNPFMMMFKVEKKDVQGLGAALGTAAPAKAKAKAPVKRKK